MPECVFSTCRLFADDSIIYRTVNNESDSKELQQDLDTLQQWEHDWGMSFNPSKCNIIHATRKKKPTFNTYYLKGTPLEAVESATYLGINIASDISWHAHVSKVAAKGNRTLGFIKRNITAPSEDTKVLAYKALVRPAMEYASTVWSPHQKILKQRVEMVQRRAARYVKGKFKRENCVTEMLENLEWETLEQRRLKARVTMGYRIVHNMIMIPSSQLIPTTVNTRGHRMKFRQLKARTDYYRHTFFPAVIPLWNSLPDRIASAASLEDFREKIAGCTLYPPA